MLGYGTGVMSEFQPQEHHLRADLRLLKEARDFAERAATAFGLENGACYQVKLAMSEAVTNAIQHGSTSPDDPIRIWATEESGALVFEVQDTGRFRPRVARRGDPLPDSGRGPRVPARPDGRGPPAAGLRRNAAAVRQAPLTLVKPVRAQPATPAASAKTPRRRPFAAESRTAAERILRSGGRRRPSPGHTLFHHPETYSFTRSEPFMPSWA